MSAPDATQPAESADASRAEPAVSGPEFRDDGRGYIDEPTGVVADLPPDEDGSSVDEEASDAPGGWPAGEGGDGTAAEDGEEGELDELDELDEGDELEDDDGDWDVDDEDWELADGDETHRTGQSLMPDFTKQYNRVRQQHAATHPTAAPSSSRLDQAAAAAPAARPLPARNAHHVAAAAPGAAGPSRRANPLHAGAATGVAANPKAGTAPSKDKADRATHEQVLDRRTRLVLSSLGNRGFFSAIEYCVSTGKEANVYYAHPPATPPPEPAPYPSSLAVKIYRTSILNFRARQSYIVGEHRFRGGYASAKNPRKMVRLWAEKELRNLRRLVQGGVRAPLVIEQRENVLVMEFLGQGNRLKDADIAMSKLPRLYAELLVAMRRMYHRCHLVHADLSEYNILHHAGHLYIIDVSQSVEHDHPAAFDFLRADIRNVDDYFTRRSGGEVRTLGVRRTWEFVVGESVGLAPDDEDGDDGEARLFDVIRDWLEREPDAAEPPVAAAAGAAAAVDSDAARAQRNAKETDDNVFMSSYIPRSLADVYDPERDIDVLKAGGADSLIYGGITGLSIHEPGAKAEAEEEEDAPGPSGTNAGDISAAAAVPVEQTGAAAAAEAAAAEAETAQAERAEAGLERAERRVTFADDVEGGSEVSADEGEESAEGAEGDDAHEKKSRGFRNEDKEANKVGGSRDGSVSARSRQARKKALKEENREKRKSKMPKGEKQRLIKKTSGK